RWRKVPPVAERRGHPLIRQNAPRSSATLLAALTVHAQGRAREGHESQLTDRLSALLTHPIGSSVESLQRRLRLAQQFALISSQRQLSIAFKTVRTDVGLVIAGPVDSAGHDLLEVLR